MKDLQSYNKIYYIFSYRQSSLKTTVLAPVFYHGLTYY